MKITVKSVNDRVMVLGNDTSKLMSRYDLLDYVKDKLNPYSLIDNVDFQDGVITIYKVEYGTGKEYKDEIVFDEKLTSDETYMKWFFNAINTYRSELHNYNHWAIKRIEDGRLAEEAYNTALDVFSEYVFEDQILPIEHDEVAKEVIKLLNNPTKKFYSELEKMYYSTDEGKSLKRGANLVKGATAISSVVLFTAGLSNEIVASIASAFVGSGLSACAFIGHSNKKDAKDFVSKNLVSLIVELEHKYAVEDGKKLTKEQ